MATQTGWKTDAYGEKTPKTLWRCRNIDLYTGYDEDWAKILPPLAGDNLEKKRPGG